MHIKEIVIKNFQSHKYTKINLSDKINVFLGKGNSGKSAIIRALIWVFFNEPQGTGFIRKNEQSAFVSITLDNGFKVIRERGVNINKYVLIFPDGEKKEFSNFGRDVPEEIRKVLGIKTLPLENGKKLNPQIKDQMENIYLLDESPSTIHSTLLTISGGQVFDEAINSILIDLQRLDRKEKEIKKDIEERENLLKNYEGIDEKKDKLLKIKNEIDAYKKLEEKKRSLEKLNSELVSIKKEKNILQIYLNSLKKVEPIEKESNFLIEHKEKVLNLRNLKNSLEKVKQNIEKISKDLILINKSNLSEEMYFELKKKNEKLDNLKNIRNSILKVKNEVLKVSKNLTSIKKGNFSEELSFELKNKKERLDNFKNIKISILKLKNEILFLIDDVNEINRKIDSNIDEYFNLIFNNKVCPVCNREIDENLKETIKNNLNRMWR